MYMLFRRTSGYGGSSLTILNVKFVRIYILFLKGKQVNLASLDELNQMRFDVQSLISECSTNDKEWDRDSAIDFEEVKGNVRRPNARSESMVSENSRKSAESKVLSKVNPSYIPDEPIPTVKVIFVLRFLPFCESILKTCR